MCERDSTYNDHCISIESSRVVFRQNIKLLDLFAGHFTNLDKENKIYLSDPVICFERTAAMILYESHCDNGGHGDVYVYSLDDPLLLAYLNKQQIQNHGMP